MTIRVEVTITNTADDRVVHYDAEFDDLEINESMITGELAIKPGPKRVKAWGKDMMPLPNTPWRKTLTGEWTTPTSKSAEQRARDLLEQCGVENAQSFTAGDVVPLANLIAESERI